ncbi:MAG: hypothetical protein ACQETD_10345 [Pseudomonadota bacterium]
MDIFAGTEYFLWEEFDQDGSQLLDETGPRYFIGLVGTNHLDRAWSVDFGGRLYSGTVDYDGQTQPPENYPVSTKTDYRGYRLELGFTRYTALRRQLDRGEWLVRFAYGMDYWRRSLRDTMLDDGSWVAGYVERYRTDYLKLAMHYERQVGWSFHLGAKAPLHTTEKVSDIPGVDETITLNPEGELSIYAGAVFTFTPQLSLSIDYDSYRFAKSDAVRFETTSGEIRYAYQPESTQDTLGVALHYRF